MYGRKVKKSRSIAFSISFFFILLNVISFLLLSYIINNQYNKIAVRNIQDNSTIAADTFKRNIEDMRFYMNDLTLKMYVDNGINEKCNQIVENRYRGETEKNILVTEIKESFYDYVVSYSFISGIGIFLEDSENTDIYLTRNFLPNLYQIATAYRKDIQDEVIGREGRIDCYNTGGGHGLIFARTIKDYSGVMQRERVNGTVMVLIRDLLQNTVQTSGGFAVLTDEEGKITYASDSRLVGMDIKGQLGTAGNGHGRRREPIVVDEEISDVHQRLLIITPMEDARLTMDTFSRTLVWSFVIIIALNLFFIWIISRLLTQPMENLVGQIQEVGVDEINRKVDAKGYREIENIGDNFNRMIDRIQNLINDNYLISLNEKNARIEALQSQINPHFIFNTLDTINWKTMFLDIPDVTRMITCLGDMLRYTTYQYGKDVTVKQEVGQIENYIYIQKIRYDYSFTESMEIDENTLAVNIPCLIIQPLVENAIVHGLKNREENGELRIQIHKSEGFLHISVRDNGIGMDAETITKVYQDSEDEIKESIGLNNVNKRLCLIYGLDQGMEIVSEVGAFTEIAMCIPLRNEQDTGEEI